MSSDTKLFKILEENKKGIEKILPRFGIIEGSDIYPNQYEGFQVILDGKFIGQLIQSSNGKCIIKYTNREDIRRLVQSQPFDKKRYELYQHQY